MFRTLRFYHSFFKFLSTPSSRRATGAARHHATVPTYFYPRPPRGGRPLCDHCRLPPALISIHALREEGDRRQLPPQIPHKKFLSTPSARRATMQAKTKSKGEKIFLSTPSARRATTALPTTSSNRTNFYPRPPRGGRHHDYARNGQSSSNFYPRPPRGGRPTSSLCHAVYSGFLSTPSARRATTESANLPSHTTISIHALREEGDADSRFRNTSAATISIHALREEGDQKTGLTHCRQSYFYPRPPRGGRRQRCKTYVSG